ncbi:hypothetical protein DP129_07175 [Clostridium tetani]|uniref:bacteriocin-associated integral membrane family protein n=1 Tax=Clostridium tetani TaxID=1513 RepID=UPI00100B8CF6|nr:DUF1430 domain-containing protein [Clostridium tetani]RXI39136.1 hypothetical protein DP129_07175 [Clostridium tetani]
MKKLISVLILVISMFSFFILYDEFKKTEAFNMKNIENNLENGYDILLPSTMDSLPRRDQYETLANATQSTMSSVFFTRTDRSGEKEKIIKYIYTMKDDYMDKINLSRGKKLDKTMMTSNYFLSTENTGDKNQVGVIESISDDFIFEVHTLNNMLDDGLKFKGFCTMDLPKDKTIEQHLSTLCEIYDVSTIEHNKVQIIGWVDNKNSSYILVLFSILVLLILYDILNSYKKIGIKKMLGYSNLDIWKEDISKLLIIQIGSIIISTIFMSIFLINKYNGAYLKFLKKLGLNYLLITIILLIVASIPYIYVQTIKISSILKNKRQTNEILIFNTLIKIGLVVGFIILLNIQITNFDEFKKLYNGSYKQWEDASNYVTLNLDNLDFYSYGEKFLKKQQKLYKNLNSKGAIFVTFPMHTTLSKDLNSNVKYFKLNGTINPNYLKKYPIYNDKGDRVYISEKNKNWVILIPDKFKNDEEQIREYYESRKKSYLECTRSKLDIIWVKSNQKYFSYDVSVNPKEGNYVEDPIVLVGTEEGLFPYWNSYIFNTVGDPVKVKINKETSPYDQIKPIINSVGIDTSSLRINFADEEVVSISNEYKNMLKFLIIGMIFIAIMLVIIVTQSVLNFFEQYKKVISIRGFHGYKSFDKYREYLWIIVISWVVAIITSIILNKASLNIVLSVALVGLIFECLLSIIFLNLINKNRLTEVMKGDS